MSENAIHVHRLSKVFGERRRLLGSKGHQVRALTEVSLDLRSGETLAIVGESGCGKSTLARILVGLETASSGRVEIAGQDAATLRKRGPKAFGKTIQYVFQDPVASLNPRKTIGQSLDAPLRLLTGRSAAARRDRMRELMAAVEMPEETLERYPHEMSGGQAQRMAIARALAAEPRIMVLDEPVSALDVSVQAQVLLLLQRLKDEFGLSYLFISHDLAVVEAIADRVAVMHFGEIVEMEKTGDLFSSPVHPYTQKLLASAPRLDR
ncbi:ATP-binding cassette domain-containing protein [Rhizobium sp. SSA_523]|uniref:ATP-binding cassette domain-containing protein n=1 Tax=Rhizobium sp. SSA_523 TaxID=2952477 RepID=UPI002090A0BC|nr:ATP-binding cassette domain-containing protein [Rhizobium sp. SSA_523]MCO5732238.1 ATP-binding cassette domain-containing protein [Rhizobium sp. SSA_523]WKC21352.1 ATP-binding cassette domain-containing protein [Rhizobium sp. SSA_523]